MILSLFDALSLFSSIAYLTYCVQQLVSSDIKKQNKIP